MFVYECSFSFAKEYTRVAQLPEEHICFIDRTFFLPLTIMNVFRFHLSSLFLYDPFIQRFNRIYVCPDFVRIIFYDHF